MINSKFQLFRICMIVLSIGLFTGNYSTVRAENTISYEDAQVFTKKYESIWFKKRIRQFERSLEMIDILDTIKEDESYQSADGSGGKKFHGFRIFYGKKEGKHVEILFPIDKDGKAFKVDEPYYFNIKDPCPDLCDELTVGGIEGSSISAFIATLLSILIPFLFGILLGYIGFKAFS